MQAAGFRPCKICRPDQSGLPPQIRRALSLLEQEDGAVSDALLRSRGINPEAVRRWFKQHYGTTFHAYRRMQRLSLAGAQRAAGRAGGRQRLSGRLAVAQRACLQ